MNQVNQRLSLVEVGAGSGVYNLKYKHSGKCIDVQNASTSNGARVEQRTCNAEVVGKVVGRTRRAGRSK